jgi:N-methylhydantoinase B/oxoprolinase/acetone carboxylase alpha subunit
MTDVHTHEQELLKEFLAGATLFLGPDPEIMLDHDIAPISERERGALDRVTDTHMAGVVRSRMEAGVNEAFAMSSQTGACPGARWGDSVCGLFTANGDLAISSNGGILIFSVLTQHAVKFIAKYWIDDPSVGVRPGDGFAHNDARYGNIHNTDSSVILPIFHDGELIAWVGCITHVGENGAIEPGGMPTIAETPFDEGLKMPPIKLVENYELKRDLITFLQNSTRDPKLIYEDMKSKLYACIRLKERLEETITQYGVDPVIAVLRGTLDDTKEEVKRRISEWPDGTTRSVAFSDGTLRENLLLKINLEMRKNGDQLVLDFRGSSPEFQNRSINTQAASMKGMLAQLFLGYIWPDLPRNQAVLAPIEIVLDSRSVLNAADEVPNAQSMMTFFFGYSAGQVAVAKFLYSATNRYTKILAPWYNMIQTFIYGGMTQHGEPAANLCADLNGMSGGARDGLDGENAIALASCAMSDLGEQELSEEENAFVQIISKKIMRDNQAFGKYRGGQGYQMALAAYESTTWGFASFCVGSKFPTISGLFGGYACPAYPLAKVQGVDVFDTFKHDPGSFKWTIEEIMNERPFEGAVYSTHHMGFPFELAKNGELYMCTQGAGGGYGDVLERDPAAVMKDLEQELISDWTAQEIYHVVYDPSSFVVDPEATAQAREAERDRRKQRGVPYADFVREWVTEGPPADLPFYGSWGDREVIYAGGYAGQPHVRMRSDAIQDVVVPHPREVRIASLEATVAELQAKLREQ